MFSKDITTSDAFREMPASSQSLYFHLGMEADDDGFLDNYKGLMRSINASEDDLKVLLGKRFLILFPSKVVVVKHWRINNTIRLDRYNETKHVEEKRALIVKENGAITQLVEDKDTAWHAGKMQDPTPYGEIYAPNPNLKTLGIAYAGFALAGPSFEQFRAICELVRHLSVIHTIQLDRKHLIFHNDIRTDKVCPGPHFNLDALIYLAQLK